MPKQTPRLNPKWVKQARDYFLSFLRETKFPHPVRNGSRGSQFAYPEWLIMLIAVLAVKAKARTYLAIHRLAIQYWDIIGEGLELNPIPETTLRYRLKKISFKLGEAPIFVFQIFPESFLK
jgi:hypothetical protein